MQLAKIIISISFIVLVSNISHAQRRVTVKTPHRTVVRTSSGVVYKRTTPYVRAVRTIPRTAVVVKRNGLSYHYYNGLYYRYYGGKYVVVTAPLGVRVKVLPVGYRRIVVLGRPYFYYQGTYYIKVGSSYKVVEAPNDIMVYELPEEAEQVVIDEKTYYEYNNKLYKIVITPEGKAFKVVGDLE